MLSLLALLLFCTPLVYSSPQASNSETDSSLPTRTEFPSTTVCNTISGTLSGSLASVPLSHFTSRPTSLSTHTETVPITVSITESAPPYTATVIETFTTYPVHSFGTLTSTIYSLVTSTVGTFTSTSTLCLNAPSPTTTTTVYTGTFSPPTPTPSGASLYPIEVDCTILLSTLSIAYTTLTAGTFTSTAFSTPLPPPIAYTTSTYTQTIYVYVTAGLTTVTTTQTARTAATASTTLAIADCPAAPTATYAAACAPTNLVGAVRNRNGTWTGIYEYDDGADTGSALTAGDDPSACCQLCWESEGCVASASSPKADNCNLLFRDPQSEGACGVALRYGPGVEGEAGVGAPGNGFVVQGMEVGCGGVEPITGAIAGGSGSGSGSGTGTGGGS